ncbi:M35 family metallo-endopeptidase [Cystobacter fuscus]|uniref:M35 family metallo-endopeptidase n=1 Tax=Cystobacter fuscus TaxID=43 RepID=UPI0037BE813E
MVGVSLLGACGAPMEGEDTSSELNEQALGDVAVSLSVASSSMSARDDVAVTVTFTNVSSQPVRMLRWYVPGTEGVKAGLFEVSRNGEEVAYIGPHVKRRAPQAEDFITLEPGQSLSGAAPLSGMYDLGESGTYSVRFAAQSTNQHNVGLTRSAILDSNLVSLWIEGRANREPEIQVQAVAAQGISSAGNCSSTRASRISTAYASAKTYASRASSYLKEISSGTARYTTWFGAYSSSRLSVARSHFANINSQLANKSIVVDCSCTDSDTYAYVYPTQPYKIYVCGAFWSAPNTGTDSRAGTLIHEMSHFTVVAGTDDHAYGQSAAKSLAKSSPTKALDNADNHEYFAENNPAQN